MKTNVKSEDDPQSPIDLRKSLKASCRQFAALSPGYLLMFVSGLHIGWGSFNPMLLEEFWTTERTDITINFVISSYYFGIFFGVLFARSGFKTGTKAFRYQISAMLCAISGIMLITSPDQPLQLIIARVFTGVAIGQAYLTLIMQSELLSKHLRGIFLSFGQFFVFIGIYVALILVYVAHETFDDVTAGKLRLIGAVIVAFSIASIICLFNTFRESPAYMIRQEKYEEALRCLEELRNEPEGSQKIECEFNELKQMVEEDEKLGPSIVTEGNLKPFILMNIVAVVSLLSFNYPLNVIRFKTIANVDDKLIIFAGILIVIRIVFGLIACNLCDVLGRKKIQTISGCACGAVLVISGMIAGLEIDIPDMVHLLIFIIYEVNAAFGVCSISTVLMFEAFPLTKRSNSITTILACESLTHIILVSATFDLDMTPLVSALFLTIFGGLMIFYSGYLHVKLPETKGLSMRQARDEYRKGK